MGSDDNMLVITG